MISDLFDKPFASIRKIQYHLIQFWYICILNFRSSLDGIRISLNEKQKEIENLMLKC
jgi:hypothetical protein